LDLEEAGNELRLEEWTGPDGRSVTIVKALKGLQFERYAAKDLLSEKEFDHVFIGLSPEEVSGLSAVLEWEKEKDTGGEGDRDDRMEVEQEAFDRREEVRAGQVEAPIGAPSIIDLTHPGIGLDRQERRREAAREGSEAMEVGLSDADRAYLKLLRAFGPVSDIPPCYLGVAQWAQEANVDVVGADIPEKEFSTLYTELVQGWEWLSSGRRMERALRKGFLVSTVEEYMDCYDKVLTEDPGRASLERTRERHIASRVFEGMKPGERAFLMVEYSRAAGVMKNLSTLGDGGELEEDEETRELRHSTSESGTFAFAVAGTVFVGLSILMNISQGSWGLFLGPIGGVLSVIFAVYGMAQYRLAGREAAKWPWMLSAVLYLPFSVVMGIPLFAMEYSQLGRKVPTDVEKGE